MTNANGIGAERILVIVPTYNEIENLPLIHRRLRDAVPAADLLVVDDGSPDGTGILADLIAAADPQVHVLHRIEKGGLGAAYIAGFGWALDRGYDVIVQMDADGSHQPEQLPTLLAALPDADLVLGSRWVPGGRVVNWPRHRLLISRIGNAYTRLALGLPLGDATGGFRAFQAGTLRSLPLDQIQSHGYCFQVDMAYRTRQRNGRIVEVPITFIERVQGHSKMSNRIVVEALLRVTGWGLRRLARR